jgi:hypothetical protein
VYLEELEIRVARHYCLPSAEALTSPYAHPPTYLQVILIVKLPSGMVLLCSLWSNGLQQIGSNCILAPLHCSAFYLQIARKREPTSGLEPLTPAPATSELFLLEEQPAPHFLGLRLIYWSATKVKVGTMCVHVLSNTSEHKIPIRT